MKEISASSLSLICVKFRVIFLYDIHIDLNSMIQNYPHWIFHGIELKMLNFLKMASDIFYN